MMPSMGKTVDEIYERYELYDGTTVSCFTLQAAVGST